MRRAVVIGCLFIASVAGCKKKESAESAAPAAPAPAAASTAPAQTAAATEPNLLAIGSGAMVAQKPQEEGDSYAAFHLLDEADDRGWSTPDGVVSPQTMVFSLAGRCELSRVELDTEGLKEGRAAKDVVVEVSDTSATSGFTKIVEASLREAANHQSFPVTAKTPARWVKLTIANNHGDKNNIELMEFRAFGKVLAPPSNVNVTGKFTSNIGDMELRQDGASIVGCYATNQGTITRGVEGRTMKFAWREAGSGDNGTGVVNFSDDGKDFFGLYWHAGENGAGAVWEGHRATGEFAGCGLTAGSAQEKLATDLEKEGRTRVYGILFDTDSATIKPESKATLDDIVALLKNKTDWNLEVEGHTDSTGSEAHNQQLSEQRAASVKNWIVNAGIAATRLTTKGFGATKPVAPNETEIGRAQNRRVELVKGGS